MILLSIGETATVSNIGFVCTGNWKAIFPNKNWSSFTKIPFSWMNSFCESSVAFNQSFAVNAHWPRPNVEFDARKVLKLQAEWASSARRIQSMSNGRCQLAQTWSASTINFLLVRFESFSFKWSDTFRQTIEYRSCAKSLCKMQSETRQLTLFSGRTEMITLFQSGKMFVERFYSCHKFAKFQSTRAFIPFTRKTILLNQIVHCSKALNNS